ncbi:MAG: hypothetical protein GKR90_26660 [Pseudomonadales bacterium]|nr:hypothetical protein [Pseudomonadales bacterium]
MKKEITISNSEKKIVVETATGTHERVVKNESSYVLKAMAGESYSVMTRTDSGWVLQDDVIVKAQGDDLLLEFEGGITVSVKSFLEVCKEDECQVVLPDGEDGVAIDGDVEGEVLGDGTVLVYAHGDSSVLLEMAAGNRAVLEAFQAEFDADEGQTTWTPGGDFPLWLTILGGVAVGAGGAAALDNGDDDDDAPAVLTIQGNISAGPIVSSNGLTVTAYKSDGEELGSARVDPGSTSFALTIRSSRPYSGPILVRVTDADADADADYVDEATGAPQDLGLDMRAIATVDGAGTYIINVNPLTELAVRETGLAGGDSGSSSISLSGLTAASIDAANTAVADAFGVADLISGPVTNTVDANGGVVAGNDVGIVLAGISFMEQSQGADTDVILGQLATSDSAISAGAKVDLVEALLSAGLYGDLSVTAQEALGLGSLEDLTPAQIAALSPEFFSTVAPSAIAGLSVAQFGAVTAEQMAALSVAQLAVISSDQAAALVDGFAGLDNAQIMALGAGAIDSVPTDVIDHLSAADVAALTDAQLAALTADQVDALAAVGSLAELSYAQFAQVGITGIDIVVEASLLGDVLSEVGRASSVAEVQALADAVQSVMDAASGMADAPSLAELALLGVEGVTADELGSVQSEIAATADDGTGVDTLQELQAVADVVPETLLIEGLIVAGPVQAGHGLVIVAFAEDGSELGTGTVNADGTYSILITGAFTGPVLVRVADMSDGADYLDEATGSGTDLTADLRAMTTVAGSGVYTLNITPLTELAVRELLGDSGADGGTAPVSYSGVTEASVEAVNAQVADLFGVDDIVGTAPVAVNDGENYATGSDAARTYGHVLAGLSGLERTDGIDSLDDALDALADSVAAGELTGEDLADLREGAEIADGESGNVNGTETHFDAINASPVGEISIVGTPTQGETLTASAAGLSDVDGIDAISYSWLINGSVVGTGDSYTLVEANVGQTVILEATYVDGGGTSETVVSAATAAVANLNDTPTGAPLITGFTQEGQTLTADATGIEDADGLGVFSYQWQVGGSDIAGANASTYTLTGDEVGGAITVVVSYTDAQGAVESVTSSATVAVSNAANNLPTGSVTILGTPTQGEILTLDTSSVADANGLGGFTYQWQANGVDIPGATSTSLLLGQDLVGQSIAGRLTFTDGASNEEALVTAATAAVADVNDTPTGSVVVTGMPNEGETLIVDTSALEDADGLGPLTYQWQADGADIVGATLDNLTLTQAQVGSVITVIVSYTDAVGNAESMSSGATAGVANVNQATVGSLLITGTLMQGETVTADTSELTDQDGLGALSYQWLVGGNLVGDQSTYTLQSGDVGETVQVVVSYADGQNTAESFSSAVSSAVANANDAPSGLPVVTGSNQEGETLGVDTSGIADEDGLGAFSYQWQVDNGSGAVDIVGATASTYVLTASEVGDVVSVVVSFTDLGGASESLGSAATAEISSAANNLVSGSVVITGTVAEGETLTADTSALTDADGIGALSYEWRADGETVGSASTYALTADDIGKTVTVAVSYTDNAGFAESVLSAATVAVANVNDAPTGAVTVSGTVRQGETLTVDASGIADADGLGVFTYQWQADGVDLSGETGSSLALDSTHVGDTITVVVSYTDAEGADESVGSSATNAVTSIPSTAMTTNEVAIDNVIDGSEDDAPVTFSGVLSSTIGVDSVTLVLNSVVYDATIDGNDWSVDIASAVIQGLADGDYTYTAVARDSEGSALGTVDGQVTYFSTPTVSIDDVSTDNSINLAEDDADITLSGTTVNVEDGQQVTLNLNNETYQAIVTAGVWSTVLPAADAQSLVAGDNALTAEVSNVAGTPAAQVSLTIDYDTTAPTIDIDDVATDNVINSIEDDSDVTISGTTENVEDGQTVTVVVGSNSYQVTVTSGVWSATMPAIAAEGLVESVETIYADVANLAGVAAEQAELDIVHDTTAILSFNVVTGNNVVDSDEAASDVMLGGLVQGIEDGQTLTLHLTDADDNPLTPVGGIPVVIANGAWEYTMPAVDVQALTAGDVTIFAEAADLSGNMVVSEHVVVREVSALTIELDTYELGVGETAEVTFTFANAPAAASFDASYVLVDNGSVTINEVADGSRTVFTGTYTPDAVVELSNTISVGLDAGEPVPGVVDVTGFVDDVSVDIVGNAITSTAGRWGSSGVFGTDAMVGDGSITWEATTVNGNGMMGLSVDNPDASYASIDYALYNETGNFTVYENGASRGTFGSIFSRRCAQYCQNWWDDRVLQSHYEPRYTAIYINGGVNW